MSGLPLKADRLEGILAFVQAAERLKDTLRSGRTRSGRAESVAEHSWRLCLLAGLFTSETKDHDLAKVLMLCIVHDLGEAVSGDVPAVSQREGDGRAERERSDLLGLCEPLPSDLRDMMMRLHDEYSAGETPEARLVKGFDKIETMLQHLLGNDRPGFDFGFNLNYGRKWTDSHPVLRQVRSAVDAETKLRVSA